MQRRLFVKTLGVLGASCASLAEARPASADWKAAVASADITPATSLWMAGYARRMQPSEGTDLPLRAKALALACGTRRAVLVTLDLLGVTAGLTEQVATAVHEGFGLDRADLLVNTSHTHSGPVIDDQLSVAYPLTAARRADIAAYARGLVATVVDLVGVALSALEPVELAYAAGEARFAANRRTLFTPDGPVDHSVPVLRVTRGEQLLAVVFGYACHNTTLQHDQVRYHGDYAGVAQATLEARHHGATALFVAGCGADINPHPRGTLADVVAHGTSLADGVDAVLDTAHPIEPSLTTRFATVDLRFATGAARAQWSQRLNVEDVYRERHARLMETLRKRDGGLPQVEAAPVQVWQLGPELAFVALGGEVVVDYALRLARDYPRRRIWAAGYSNDVFGYLPSERVLREGGYEGGDAMIYYGRPGPFASGVEAAVHRTVRRLMAH